jgi:hypothetical protein
VVETPQSPRECRVDAVKSRLEERVGWWFRAGMLRACVFHLASAWVTRQQVCEPLEPDHGRNISRYSELDTRRRDASLGHTTCFLCNNRLKITMRRATGWLIDFDTLQMEGKENGIEGFKSCDSQHA